MAKKFPTPLKALPAEELAELKAAREKAEAEDAAFTLHIRGLQNEMAATARIAQLSLKDPAVAALALERDTLLARVAELESQLSGKPLA